MITKEIRLSDAQASKLLIAATVCGITGHDLILSAVNAALQCMADDSPNVAKAFADIDQREAVLA